jgi:class 3 adenylate cyclase/CHASE2 domain-containing sensor protein
MSTTRVKRKLTAILSADVEGYSRLMGQDELATVETLKENRKVIAAHIQQYDGRVVDAPGDNLLAEFGSVVDAAQCAVKIQQVLKAHNDALPEERRMEFRIGINLGDVIEDGDRIYGDGINIAARVEGLAEAGGVCISGTVYDQIKNKLPLEYLYLGEQAVKNISEPIRVYRIMPPVVEDGAGLKPKQLKAPARHGLKTRRSLTVNLLIVCLVMVLGAPFLNAFNLNLLTKIWQCRLVLLPNADRVTVVTIGPDEHKKMNVPVGEDKAPPYLSNPKMWRHYHPSVIAKLHEMGAEAVGFDFWFSPSFDDATQQATDEFVESLNVYRAKGFPIVVGQAQNDRDPGIYQAADWGYISLYKDLSWINSLMYLYAWDKMDLSGMVVEKPSLFVQVLGRKLGLTPVIDGRGVRLIGKPIPRRLWLAFSETPFTKIPYHEIYNGWADAKGFSGRIVLIGLSFADTDFFQVPYSPMDFTPHDKGDNYGMPGVFLFAHAINQIMHGHYHRDINDEWAGPRGGARVAIAGLESLVVLLLETIMMCLWLHFVHVLIQKKGSVKLARILMSLAAVALIIVLALIPALFGLANLVIAALVFIGLSTLRRAGRTAV